MLDNYSNSKLSGNLLNHLKESADDPHFLLRGRDASSYMPLKWYSHALVFVALSVGGPKEFRLHLSSGRD